MLVRRDRNHPSVVIWSLCNEGMCDRGIKGGVPAFDAAGLIDKRLFEKWDPLMGRVVSANPHVRVFIRLSLLNSFCPLASRQNSGLRKAWACTCAGLWKLVQQLHHP